MRCTCKPGQTRSEVCMRSGAPVQSCAVVSQATEQRHQAALQQERSLHQQQLARARAAQVGRHRARDLGRRVVAVRAFESCTYTQPHTPRGQQVRLLIHRRRRSRGRRRGRGRAAPGSCGRPRPGRTPPRRRSRSCAPPWSASRPPLHFGAVISGAVLGASYALDAHRWFRSRQTGVHWARHVTSAHAFMLAVAGTPPPT